MKTQPFLLTILLALALIVTISSGASAQTGPSAIDAVTEFQDGVAPTAAYADTRDTYVSQPNPDTNYGSAQILIVDGGAGATTFDNWALIMWDVSAIPAGSVVNSASVTLNVTDNGTSQTYHFYEITGGWNEITVTWNNKPAWAATSLGAVGPFGSEAVTLNLDKAVVQKWVNTPAANSGIIIADSDNTSGFDFTSREVSVPTARPKLTVNWTAAGANCATQTEIPQAECEALVALYTSTNGPNWSDSPGNGWNQTQTPCDWAGVTCAWSPRHVTRVGRDSKNLTGTISDLSSLSFLRILSLWGNQISGAIPDISALTSLRYLNLGANQLTGHIPSVATLTNLQVLDLRDNQIDGSIPDLSTLTALVDLFLWNNHLTGSIPSNLPSSLKHIGLYGNQLGGSISNPATFTDLRFFEVHNNQLMGTVPNWVCTAQDGYLNLGYNRFTGAADPCVTAKDPDWAATQTVPPTNVQAQRLSANSIEWSWTPIPYTGDGGYYEVRCANQTGGPYTSMGTTAATGGKTAASFTAYGLTTGAPYYCVVRTFTPTHGLQQNDLTSIDSAEVFTPSTGPQTFNVTKTADTNDGACTPEDCSLREAVIAANANPGTDTINIPAGTYLLTIAGSDEDQAATGDLDLTEQVIVKGAGSSQTIVDGDASDHVFDAFKDTEFRGLTIQNGNIGGIRQQGATLIDVVVQDSAVGTGLGRVTGGTFIHNTLGVESCDVHNVTVRENNDGILCVAQNAHLILKNSVVASNANVGIVVHGTDSTAATLVNVTVTGNRVALRFWDEGPGDPTADIRNSTIVDNRKTFEFNGPEPTPRNSIIGSSGGWGLAAFNGHYFDLLPTSRAIDAGDNTICPSTDQIGNPRPVDGNGDGIAVCDIGAIEYQPPTGPTLQIPSGVQGARDVPVVLPVNFAAHGHNIAALTFSIDFDQTCLTVDKDGDGVPDNISFDVPASFITNVTYDPNDADGELDFLISDLSPPLASLPDGALVRITFTPICQPPPGTTQTARVGFSSDPAASFGSTTGQSIPGAAIDGSIDIQSVRPGDGNGDGVVDAGDITAIVLEIFDGDGDDPANAGGGGFAGTSGCDANRDGKIDAADITCTVLIIFGLPCGPTAQARVQAPVVASAVENAPSLAVPETMSVPAGGVLTVPVTFAAHGQSIASVVFSLDYDQRWLSLDPTDANGDGLPDAVRFTLPAQFTPMASHDAADTEGELDIAVADLAPPLASLPDGVLVEIDFTAGLPPWSTAAFVKFALQPLASFGSTTGQSVAGSTSDGVVAIVTSDIFMPLFLRQ